MELSSQFQEFLKEIRPKEAQKEAFIEAHTTLTQRLAQEESLKGVYQSTFLQGSYRRSTMIRPVGNTRPDVDVVVVTSLNPSIVSPAQAIETFIPFVEKYYPGSFERNGRSIAIETNGVDVDLVVTAVEPGTDKKSLSWESITNRLDLEATPGWRLDEQWSSTYSTGSKTILDSKQAAIPLRIPDREVGKWKWTNPIEQILWTAEKNGKTNGHYVNLVKALKWWKTVSQGLPKYPKGYPFEHIIGDNCPDGLTSIGRGVTGVLEGIRDAYKAHIAQGRVPILKDRGIDVNVLERISFQDFSAFYESVSQAATIARNALDSEDGVESTRLWRQLFGEKFPSYGNGDGGESGKGGYTKPAAAAVIGKGETPRFA